MSTYLSCRTTPWSETMMYASPSLNSCLRQKGTGSPHSQAALPPPVARQAPESYTNFALTPETVGMR